MTNGFVYDKSLRLSGKRSIDFLFSKGDAMLVYPYRVVFCTLDNRPPGLSMMISVPKKRYKRAVHRNRVKRLVRESFRLNCSSLKQKLEEKGRCLHLAFIYVGKDIRPFEEMQRRMQKVLSHFENNINHEGADH